MKKSILATMAFLTLAGAAALAQTTPAPTPTPNPNGPHAGQRGGRRLGPQDGSGPIHQPGTGGGSGLGRRAGRK